LELVPLNEELLQPWVLVTLTGDFYLQSGDIYLYGGAQVFSPW